MKLTIPYYLHKAGAGFPSPATDYIEEDIDLNVHLIKNVPATFIIRVQGKSMVDVGINDGDLLVVDKSLTPKNFSTVIANVHDELVVKTLVKEKDKQFLKEILLTTNGTQLKKYAKDISNLGVDRINISLDTLIPEKFQFITNGGNLKLVLDGLFEAKKQNIEVKINTVLLKNFNEDEINNMVYWCHKNGFK